VDRSTIIWFVTLVAAIILHEISHGVVALFFGDDTAKRAGRLTLNPIPHVDPFGSIILPALGAISGFPVIGWAKPVPVNPAGLRNPRRDMLFVSLAGPGTNFALAIVAAVVAKAIFAGSGGGVFRGFDELSLPVVVLFQFAVVNVFLGMFNLLPIPPLDGSAIVERALPASALPGWYRFRPYGMLILFVLVFSTNFVSRFFTPFWEALFEWVFDVRIVG
jgi:Zn-dependent protease